MNNSEVLSSIEEDLEKFPIVAAMMKFRIKEIKNLIRLGILDKMVIPLLIEDIHSLIIVTGRDQETIIKMAA